MEQSSESANLQAFNLLRRAARDYNNAEFKFYQGGFFKYVREGKAFLIEDIYIEQEFRGTPLASLILNSFERFMREEEIMMYYGRVFKKSSHYLKRLNTFKKWGMQVSTETELFTVVSKMVEY